MSEVAELPAELQRASHPLFPTLEAEDVNELGLDWARQYNEVRDQAIRMEKEDALRYGHENPVWKKLDGAIADFRKRYPVGVIVVVVFGGTRSSKTEWRSKRTIENMLEKPDYQTWACHSTQESSREAQQKKLYKYIPPEFKPESGRFREGKLAKVVYSPWGGFTEGVFAFQSNAGGTSECHLKFYGMDPRSLRGAEINDGWMDEESSIEWLDELIARATTRNGIVYLTFQAGNGVTPLVSAIISGAKTIEEVEAKLLPIRKPRGQRSQQDFEGIPNKSGAADAVEVGVRDLSPVGRSQQSVKTGTEAARIPTHPREQDPCGPGNQSAAAQPVNFNEEFDIVGYEKVPRIQENAEMFIATGETGEKKRKVRALIFYFHTSDNVYGNPESQIATLEGANREKILSDFYGVPTQSKQPQFPLFNDTVHVVSLNLFRQIQWLRSEIGDRRSEGESSTSTSAPEARGTWYQYLDPCSGRNWFFDYVFVDPLGRKFVAAEFPSHGHDWAYIPGIGMPEPWAIPGDAKDGAKGGGQKEWGWGYRQYLEEMARLEALLAGGELKPEWRERWTKWESYEELAARYTSTITVRERWIDARYGNTRKTDEENPTTLIIDLSEYGMDFLAAPSEKAINSGRGGGDGSLRMINDMLFYDVTRPVDLTNTPHLFMVETCPNGIFALKYWTGIDGQKGATKDPIDTKRMLALTDAQYVDVENFRPQVHSHFQRR